MNIASLGLLSLLLVQVPAGDQEAPPEIQVVSFEGTLAEGLLEIERLAEDQEFDDALTVTRSVLAPTSFDRWCDEFSRRGRMARRLTEWVEAPAHWLGLVRRSPAQRAQLHYAEGRVQFMMGSGNESNEGFERARAGAGQGELRLASVYNLGVNDMLMGEFFRSQIPEISGQQQGAGGLPGTPQVPGGAPGQAGTGGPGEGEQPDPLEIARAAYLAAREHLIERLKSDWRDADTRANVELVQRRLRELAEIEQQREEQEDQEQEDQEDQEESDEEQEQDEEKEGDEEEQEDDESGEDEKDEQEQESEDEQEPEEQQDEEKEAQSEPQEIHLTKEQVQQLLQRLKEIEEEGDEVERQLNRQRRRTTKRDW